MEPTFVAPTAVSEKKPCFQRPTYTARSFKVKRSGIHCATFGFTLKSSPANKNIHIEITDRIKTAMKYTP